MRALLLLALVACGGEKDKPPPAKPEVQGTLSLDGKPLTIVRCRAGQDVTTYVELLTARGKLRFEDKQMWWSADDPGRGDKLECEKLDRSWGGGKRKDGTAYFRGHLIFVCRGPVGALAGDVTVDCGSITAEEREQLDKGRNDLLSERCPSINARAAQLGATSRCLEDKWSSELQACVLAAADKAAWDACLSPR